MTLPMLMGSMPSQAPMVCIDCGAYFWLGVIGGVALSIAAALLIVHISRR